jgi:hypothetical protein
MNYAKRRAGRAEAIFAIEMTYLSNKRTSSLKKDLKPSAVVHMQSKKYEKCKEAAV